MPVPLVLSVIGTGLGLGVVHVMTGPDHLSALSTLSVGKPLKIAFGLGVRWGCGHSFGLLIVAIIFFAVGQSIDLSHVTYWADMFVGIFMILLGLWYSLKAWRERMHYLQAQERNPKDAKQLLNVADAMPNSNELSPQELQKHQPKAQNAYNMSKLNEHQDEENIEMQEMPEVEVKADDEDAQQKNKADSESSDPSSNSSSSSSSSSSANSEIRQLNGKHSSYQNDSGQLLQIQENGNNGKDKDDDELDSPKYHKHVEDEHDNNADNAAVNGSKLDNFDDAIPDDDIIIDGNASRNPLFDEPDTSGRNKCMTRLAAFVAGIVAGIAGPGGVLGVMVALKLNDWLLSSLYLLLFFASSIATMGLYAIIYGYCTQRMTVCANNKQRCAFILKIVSAIFSLAVGILWLTLTFTGTLETLFEK